MCQNLWREKGCRSRPLLSAHRGTRMKVPSYTSNRSTKRSNLIRKRPLTNRRVLIRLTSASPCHLHSASDLLLILPGGREVKASARLIEATPPGHWPVVCFRISPLDVILTGAASTRESIQSLNDCFSRELLFSPIPCMTSKFAAEQRSKQTWACFDLAVNDRNEKQWLKLFL